MHYHYSCPSHAVATDLQTQGDLIVKRSRLSGVVLLIEPSRK